MKVTISFFGPIKKPWPENTREIEISGDLTLLNLLGRLGYSEEDMKKVAVVINGKRAGLQQRLREKDDIRVVLLAGGG